MVDLDEIRAEIDTTLAEFLGGRGQTHSPVLCVLGWLAAGSSQVTAASGRSAIIPA